MKKIISFCFHMICCGIAGMAALILVGNCIGIRPFITMSGSMEPTVQTGSLCLVNTKVDFDRIETGDIIAFRISEEVIVTHRVISVTDEGLETKGDANRTPDMAYVTAENFYGKTFFSVPWLGYGMYYLQQPVCLIIGIIILVTIGLWDRIDRRFADWGDTEPEEQKGRQI